MKYFFKDHSSQLFQWKLFDSFPHSGHSSGFKDSTVELKFPYLFFLVYLTLIVLFFPTVYIHSFIKS